MADALRNIIANIFISEISIPGSGLITVTNVKLTNDLKIAKIYISFFENRKSIEDLIDIIIKKRTIIRHYISNDLELKYIPELRFYYDDSIGQADKINNLINKIHFDG